MENKKRKKGVARMDFSFPLETEMPIDAFYWCEHAMFDQKRPFPNEDSLLDGNEVPLPSIESLDGKGHSSECTLVKGESAGALKREESITPLFKEFVATMVASPNSSIVKLKIMLDNFPKGTMWLERSGKEVLLKYHLFSVKDYLPQFTHVLPATTMAIFERSLKHAGLRVKQTR